MASKKREKGILCKPKYKDINNKGFAYCQTCNLQVSLKSGKL